jgi:hypothetical protein
MRLPGPSLLSRIPRRLLVASFLIALVSPGSLRAEPIDEWFLGLFGIDSGGHGHGAPSQQGPTEIQGSDFSSGYRSSCFEGDIDGPGLPGSGDGLLLDDGSGLGGPVVDCGEWIPENGGGGDAPAPVPEPATIVLCLLGAGALAVRRARR